jgi:hypothetical protein
MPRTQDGVEIRGGEVVWNFKIQQCLVAPVVPGRKTLAWGPIGAPPYLQIDYHVIDCFSTRAAAIADARKSLLERIAETQKELLDLDELESTPEEDQAQSKT